MATTSKTPGAGDAEGSEIVLLGSLNNSQKSLDALREQYLAEVFALPSDTAAILAELGEGGAMSIANFQVPRERLTAAMGQSSAAHLRPVMLAVRARGCGLCIVSHGDERFSPPRSRPNILIIGDDMVECLGRGAFIKNLRIKCCRSAMIVSCESIVAAYAAATAAAPVMRIVETRLVQEEDWRSFITRVLRDIAMLVATVRPEAGVH